MSLEVYNLKKYWFCGVLGSTPGGKIRPLQEKLEKKIQWKIEVTLTSKQYSKDSKIPWTE